MFKYLISLLIITLSLSIDCAAAESDFRAIVSEAGEIVIPAYVSTIPPFAFSERRDIKKVTFQRGSRCKAIGEGAFYRCDSLQKIVLPPSVREIGKYAFAWCENLQTVEFPGVGKIGSLAFAYCAKLENPLFPSSLKSIGNNAFSCCQSITDVAIPKSVTTLESYAFSGCTNLKSAVLPPNGALLGELIFSGCENLTELRDFSPIVPAFDCASFIFEPDDSLAYQRCKLIVAKGMKEKFSAAPGWKLFTTIEQ